MSSSTFTSPAGLLKNFDCDLQSFYHAVLCRELDALDRVKAKELKNALREVVSAYRRDTVNSSLRFDTPAKRCAYVLKHSPCFTSAVTRHLLRLFSNHRQLLKSFQNGHLQVCCLGGGPASDAVAIAKVVSSLYRPRWAETGRPLRFDVNLVDLSRDWVVTARNVLGTLQEDGRLLGVEGLDIRFKFVQADLTGPMVAGVREMIREADVLTMVYFLSAVNGGRDTSEAHYMLKEIMKNLKEDALLFFLDSAADVHYRQMTASAKNAGNMEEIYGPHLEEFHSLSLASVKKFLDLYKRDFDRFICMTNCFLSASAWLKREWSPAMVIPVVDHNNGAVTRQTDLEKTTRLTKRMLAFRASVQRTVDAEFGDAEIEIWCDENEDLEDSYESFLAGHSDFVPDYFFQTKSKKKRIFTGLPLSI